MNPIARKLSFLALFLVIGAWGVIALRGPNGLSALNEKRRQIRDLQEQNASLTADNERKRSRIALLKTSRPAQDLEIRERLKLLRPGETQFILPDAPKEGSSPAVDDPAGAKK
jgi:cell division protein FtsB